jgi:cellulose synthase/poly-beta-1,6-N-acetylglucosamine synthase-like glycosyltransferase
MFNNFLIPIAILYLIVVGLLFLYGMNYYTLAYLAWRNQEPARMPPEPESWPFVTIQLPLYNEYFVAARVIEAAAKIDYPADRLEIQVLDDSTDETYLQVYSVVARLQSEGINIVHIHRSSRVGFKAGALAEGLKESNGEYLAIFDADFVPPPDFLIRSIPHFQDDTLAFIQTRWGHLNQGHSFLTSMQALTLDSHFVIEQYARHKHGLWFNFNGTAGIWRKAAIIDAGGWKATTLTEDLDLSYRSFLSGWNALYLRDVVVDAELPVDFLAFRRQQHRWARGGFECAMENLPKIWQTKVSFTQKIAATFHLTSNLVYILLLMLTLLYPFALSLAEAYGGLLSLFGIGIVFNLTALAPTVFFVIGQHLQGKRWLSDLPRIFLVSILSSGMMLNTTRAAIQALLGRKAVFERTPKRGGSSSQVLPAPVQYRLKLDPIVYLEITLAIYNLGVFYYGLTLGNLLIASYAFIFSLGLFYISLSTLYQAIQVPDPSSKTSLS